MTRTRAAETHNVVSRLMLLAVLVAMALLFAPGARPGGGDSITACDGVTNGCGISTVPAANGVDFTVTTGGGNRDYASVEVICDNGYDTILTVVVPAKGTGTSQIVYPPTGSCVANVEKQMAIGRARVLASVSFTVT